jgi:hypothetical protein
MELDEMECLCGEILRGEKGKGQLFDQYQNHMLREDHKPKSEAWSEAADRIDKAKERAKSKNA